MIVIPQFFKIMSLAKSLKGRTRINKAIFFKNYERDLEIFVIITVRSASIKNCKIVNYDGIVS